MTDYQNTRGLAHLQVAENWTETPSSTLHSDGTYKFGREKKFQVATNEDSLHSWIERSCLW